MKDKILEVALNKEKKYYKEDKLYLGKNKINIIFGKNNIGKTSLLNSIEFKSGKLLYLDLNTTPFEDLKQPSDMSKTVKSESYNWIKEQFFNSEELKNAKSKIIEMVKEDIKFDSKLETWKSEYKFLEDLNITVDIDEDIVKALDKKPFIFKGVSQDVDQVIHDVNQLGLGNIRVMIMEMLLKVIKTTDKEKDVLLIIDEPEAFLHPTFIKRVCDNLKQLINENQNLTILLTSHSPYVAFEMRDYFLYFKKMILENGEASFMEISDLNSLNKRYLQYSNKFFNLNTEIENSNVINAMKSCLTFDMAKLFFEDKIIAVEGLSDLLVFEADVINNFLKKQLGDFDVIQMYGLENLPKTATLLSFFCSKYKILCDTDKRKNGEDGDNVTKIDRIKELNSNIVRFKEGEIEDLIGIEKVDKPTSKKPSNILKHYDEINTMQNAEKIFSYLEELTDIQSEDKK
jgi:predicted ATP-dependent endonuclease of OLD family